jgi:hypothetical protein
MRWVQRRDGWIVFDRDMRIILGLVARSTCSEAVKRLTDLNFLETRGTPGSRLECRLNPNWAKPKAEIVDLATRKEGAEALTSTIVKSH